MTDTSKPVCGSVKPFPSGQVYVCIAEPHGTSDRHYYVTSEDELSVARNRRLTRRLDHG